MRWIRESPEIVARMAERRPWLFALASIVFWTLLAPLALVWLALRLIDHHQSLDKSPAARRERRVARLLRWYPADWRARYGEEMAATLQDTLADGRGGPLLSLDLAREGLAARLAPPARRDAIAALCLTLCCIPLFPQGLVPAVIKLTDGSTRSWFLALYLPDAYQWPVIIGMIALGLGMLRVGLRMARTGLIAQRG
jgi:hypothetical protein